MKFKPKKCPKCGSSKIAEILRGMPPFSKDLEQKINSGEIVLGGCVVSDNDPIWHCNTCEHEWGKSKQQ